MSDFDEEAERERLREKYEQEQADREATERMSELLLQGATMTNAHCSNCGDPIFRYDGQEFCATCEKAVDRDGDADAARTDADQDGDEGESEDQDEGERIEVTAPDEETRVQFGADSSGASRTDEDSDLPSGPDQDRDSASGPDQPADSPVGRPAAGREPGPAAGSDGPGPVEPDVPQSGQERAEGLTGARRSLTRTLTRLTRRAEAAEDPARASEYLAAAREAAETLAALRR